MKWEKFKSKSQLKRGDEYLFKLGDGFGAFKYEVGLVVGINDEYITTMQSCFPIKSVVAILNTKQL